MNSSRICPVCKHIENSYTFFCTECGAKTVESNDNVADYNIQPSNNAYDEKDINKNLNSDQTELVNDLDSNYASIEEEPNKNIAGSVTCNENNHSPKDNKKVFFLCLSIIAVVAIIVIVVKALPGIKEPDSNVNEVGKSENTPVNDSWEEPLTLTHNNVYDYALLFQMHEISDLDEFIEQSMEETGLCIAVATTDDLNGKTTKQYADDLRDDLIYNYYGYLLLLDMENRRIYVSTAGEFIDDSTVETVVADAGSYLNNNEYYEGAIAVINSLVSENQNYGAVANNQELDAKLYDEEGIHIYELIVSDVTWTEAYNNCISKGGYLARINSDEEYQMILQQIVNEGKEKVKFWIGGKRDIGNSYDYYWIYEDGSYGEDILNKDDKYLSYWLEGEPSYKDDATNMEEQCMNMFYLEKAGRWVWNDAPDDIIAAASFYSGTIGYICEYEN